MSYLYDLGKPWLFGVPNKIVWDTGMQPFNTHKTWAVPGKSGQMGSLCIHVNKDFLNILQQRELK